MRVNGEVGLAFYFRGHLHSVATVDTDGDRIYGYYSISNPDNSRLRATPGIAGHTARRPRV